MLNFAEINELCEKYYISERGVMGAILSVLKRYYEHKNVHFFDIDRQLVCCIKNDTFQFFKPKGKDFKAIKNELIRELQAHKAQLLKQKPQMFQKAFLEHFGSEYVRASIVDIEGENVLFSLTQSGKAVGNLRINVSLYDFLDSDKIGIGHNFLLRIKSVKREQKFFILGCVRKDNGVIKREIDEIIGVLKRKVLQSQKGQKAFSEADFTYRFVGINIKNKEARIELESEIFEHLMVSVARIIKHRLGFNLKWRVKQ